MDGEMMYWAANAVATWLGMDGGWIDIVAMQCPENMATFRKMLKKAT